MTTKKSAGRSVNVVEYPLLSEKGARVEADNTYTFIVRKQATKMQIKAAIEHAYKVKVEKVNTVNYMGKVKRVGNNFGRVAARKKAYVKLKEGHKISLVEGL
jgi:large subunit ribosomal protein L23